MTLVMVLISLIYMGVLSIVYFKQKHISNKEIKIYSSLLLINLVGLFSLLIFNILCFYLSKNSLILVSLGKFNLIYTIWFSILITYYIHYISSNDVKDIFANIYIVLALITTGIVLVLPINIIDNYTSGISVDFVFYYSMALIIYSLFIMLFNIKKVEPKKYIPLMAFLIGSIVSIIIDNNFSEVMISPIVHSIVLFIMYFTIENPDIELIRKLEYTKNQAEKANSAKSEFLSSMSHEIRTPLNAVIGSISLLQDEKLSKSGMDILDDLSYASTNLLDIVTGILSISKIESGTVDITRKNYNIRSSIEEVANIIKIKLKDKPVDLIINYGSDLPEVLYGDKSKLKEIVSNLLSNACKYTQEGKIGVSVNSINDYKNCKIIIKVEDTGVGIKDEMIDKLFDKFTRDSEHVNSTIEGTGLGLAITKKLVEMMGGKITVQSKLNVGSIFTVYLTEKYERLDLNKEEVKEEREIVNASGQKILIIDDNEINLKVERRLLERKNYDVDTCLNAKNGIDMAVTGDYDLILMDDMMPEMSGTEAMKVLKDNYNYNKPIIVLTANAKSGDRKNYLRKGFDDYIAKPVKINDLMKVINKYI